MLAIALCAALVAFAPSAAAKEPAKKRAEIDRMSENALATLFEESPLAKRLYEKSVAYAVFDNLKLSLFLSGGGGAGVAVDKSTGARTYMRMGTAGINIGLGGKKYQVVFLFQDAKVFRRFVEKGWQAGAEASAVAGKAGVAADASFVGGLAVFQITDAGLMVNADINGTKYWKWEKLNQAE